MTAIGHNNPPPIRPKGIPPLSERFCLQCGHPFFPKREDQKFCPGSTCRSRHHHKRTARAVELYDFAMNFRRKRAPGGFTEFCQVIDGFIADDRADEKRRQDFAKQYRQQKKANTR